MDDLFDRIGRGFRSYYERPEALILVLLGVAALAAAGILLHAFFSPRARSSRLMDRVFLRFAAASGLTGPETSLLRDVARALALENPAILFVRRSLFENAASQFGMDAAQADSIRRKVYGP